MGGSILRKLITTVNDKPIEVIVDDNVITMSDAKYAILKRGDLMVIQSNGFEMQIDDIMDQGGGNYRVEIRGFTIDVKVDNPLDLIVKPVENPSIVKAPLTGVVSKVFVKEGEEVSPDTILLTISAMKMENKILSKANGRVKSINVNIGDQVKSGNILIELEDL